MTLRALIPPVLALSLTACATNPAYGDNPDQGVVRGATFLHARLRFAIDFPAGWDVNNGQTQVVAKQPGASALILLQPLSRPVGRTIQDVALRSMEGAGFRAVDGRSTTINGLSIAEHQGHGVVKASTLAIMNGHAVTDQPRPAERLEIVVAG